MALSSTTVNGTAVPGLMQSISLGAKAASPSTNITPPTNTLPKSQSTPINDLSGSYANVNGTIYNKGSGQGYSTPEEFYKAAGVNSFNNLKFDTAWTPQKTVNAPTPQSTQTPPQSTQTPPTAGILPSLAASTATTATGAPAPSPAPNGGATGVSQGSIINGQVTNAVNNPAYKTAMDNYNSFLPQIAALQKSLPEQLNAASQDSGDMSLALGREGQINKNTGGLLQGLSAAQAQALAAANAAISEQSTTNSGLSSAATANAPVPTSAYSSPSASTTTGQTTSGAASLSSLVGTRPGADGNTTEYYDTQSGKGFSTPQELADFVNKQMPNSGATPANVFGLLQATHTGQAVDPSNPYYKTLQGFAEQMANGQMAAVPYSSMPAVIQNQLLQMAKAVNPNFDFNTATAQGASQQAIVGSQTQQAATWKSAQQQSQALTGQLQPLLSQINPSQFTFVNGAIQAVASQLGNPTYQQAANLLTEIANTYANVLNPAGGTLTDSVRSTANGLINGLANGQSIQQVIAGLDAQAQAKISAIPTATNLGGLTNGNGANIPAGALTIN